ncbi:MAG: hypothetical protein J6125_04485 [Clostridia bacterium]|nr:hypothetical protein [Clostridia bacterium]
MKKHLWGLILAVLLCVPVVLLGVGLMRTAVPRVTIDGQRLDPSLRSYTVTYRDGHSVVSGDDIENRAREFYVGHEHPIDLLLGGHEIDFGRRAPDPSDVLIACFDEAGDTLWAGPRAECPAAYTSDNVASAILFVRWRTTARTSVVAVYYFD